MASTIAERRVLRRIPAMRSLSRRELDDVQERMIEHSYRAGDVIWRTHGPLRFSGTILSGELDLETRVGGTIVRTTRLVAGDPLPPRALLMRRTHAMLIARAVTDVSIGILPELHERPAALAPGRGGQNWLWPVLLFLLVAILARDDILRISSGLLYLVSTPGEEVGLQDPRSMILLETAQKLDKGAAFAYNEQGYRWFLLNELPAASAAFNKAVTMDPSSAPALNNLAITYFAQGDLSQAAGNLQRSMEKDPDNPIARYNLGITLMQLGEPAGALREFREAGFIDPEFASPLLQQAYLYQQLGDYANAEQRARSVIQLNPSLVPAHLLLGMSLYQQGLEDGALASFREALQLEPGSRVAAFYLALILGHQEQYDGALLILHELLGSSTDTGETARILSEIDALYRYKSESAADGP